MASANNLNAPIIKSDVNAGMRGRKGKSRRNNKYVTMAMFNRVLRMLNVEEHYSDITVGSTAISTTATLTLLNGSQTGDGVSNRTGVSIRMNGCDIRFSVTGNATAVSTLIRVIIVLDHSPDGLIFASGDLLAATNVWSPLSSFNQMRFVTLYDTVFSLTTAGPFQQVIVKHLSNNYHVMYNAGNAGSVADINTNSLYLYVLSDQATNTPTIQGQFRTWFIDN